MAPIRELETVVLLRDVPEVGLRAGDLGAVVHVAPEVEDLPVVDRAVAGVTICLPLQIFGANIFWQKNKRYLNYTLVTNQK